jgi:integrase
MEFPMSVLNGEIAKITIAPYRGGTTLEASVKMLVEGQEIRRRWKSPHTSRTATERWAREKAKSYLTTRAAKEKEPAPIMAEYAVRYVVDHVRTCKLRPSTADTMHTTLKHHLIPMFGELRVDQINDDHINEIKSLDLAAGTINHILQVLSQILKHAAAKGLLSRMPEIKRIRDRGGRHGFYSPADYNRLVTAAASEPRALVLVLLAGDAGMRIGEIMALEWSRIDYGANKVHVELSDWRGHIGPPKGGKPRSVPMTPRLRAALRDLEALRDSEASSARVLTRSQGRFGQEGARVTYSSSRQWLRAAHARAGVTPLGIHALRHTFCSHLAMAGAPVTAIRDLAGHSSVAITQRYMHLAPAGMVSAIDLLANVHATSCATSSVEKGGRHKSARREN